MAKAPSTKALFRATKPRGDKGPRLFEDLPRQAVPDLRDELDFDPTPADATNSFLLREAEFIRAHGPAVAEDCVGAGHIAAVLKTWGFRVVAGDVVDRGYPSLFCLGDFMEQPTRRAAAAVTNPPYNLVNARDGGGRWLRHMIELGYDYIALLLNADWSAARVNGFDALFHENPPSIEYLCCWKIDFRGLGAPPQRNSWMVWDRNRPALGPGTWIKSRLYRDDTPPGQIDMGFDL